MYISPQHAMLLAVHFVTLFSNAVLTSVTHYDIHFATMEQSTSFLHSRIQSVINFKSTACTRDFNAREFKMKC